MDTIYPKTDDAAKKQIMNKLGFLEHLPFLYYIEIEIDRFLFLQKKKEKEKKR